MSTTNPSLTPKPILLIGAGELGISLLQALTSHPIYTASPSSYSLTLALRPSTLTSATRAPDLTHYRSICPTLSLIGIDLASPSTTSSTLAQRFRQGGYECIVHASGMTLPLGAQRKLCDAVIEAGVSRYIPWQFGVAYDTIGPLAGGSLFSEACEVRTLLRAQSQTKWLVLQCGIFTSFLFEEIWGVVVPDGEAIKARALGSWEDSITATAVKDIGAVTAELVLGKERDGEWKGNIVSIAGDTLTYGDLADLVGRVSGKEVLRELWDREKIAGEVQKEQEAGEGKIWKYRAVFGGGEGVAWPVKGTWNEREEKALQGVEGWLKENWTEAR